MRPKSFDPDHALDRAMLKFWSAGFEGSSMQELVECMGISRQSLYDTFGNKRELFEEALRLYRTEFLEPRLALLTDTSLRPTEALRGFFESLSHENGGQPAGCLIIRTINELGHDDDLLAGFSRQCVVDIYEALLDVIQRGQARGNFDQSQPASALARLALAAANGMNVLNKLPGGGAEFQPTSATVLAALGATES